MTASSTGLYINTLRGNITDNTTGVLFYNTGTNEIQYITTQKTFIIDHPIYPENKYLIHGCLEGPENGVYYRGKGEIINNYSTFIELPHYVNTLAYDFIIQLTPIFDGKDKKQLQTSEVNNYTNSFEVFGENGKFYWVVFAKRGEIMIEPNKSDIVVKGDGPYKYYEFKK